MPAFSAGVRPKSGLSDAIVEFLDRRILFDQLLRDFWKPRKPKITVSSAPISTM
jgi:hypothetical protein